MNSYVFDIGGKARTAARFIGEVRAQLQSALISEKKARKLTQQKIANLIGVNRSVINRQLMGFENLTLRRVAELAWALGYEIVFYLQKRQAQSIICDIPQTTGTRRHDTSPQVQWISLSGGVSTGSSNKAGSLAA
jgi:transcriptional regulator with XRE-family HTH domain